MNRFKSLNVIMFAVLSMLVIVAPAVAESHWFPSDRNVFDQVRDIDFELIPSKMSSHE